jgi:FkbM family methyltransferase
VSPESALQYWRLDLDHPKCSKLLFDFAVRFVRPGSVVWDIGANCGVFAFSAASLAGRTGKVIAVEPDRFLTELLHRTSAELPASSAAVTVLGCAAADRLGAAALNIAMRGRSTNFLERVQGRSDAGGVRRSETVLTLTLDWMSSEFPPPTVLKIDVEGAEALVLRGASKLLSSARPVVLCEVSDDTRAEVLQCLRRLDYRLFDPEAPDGQGSVQDAPNIVAVPSAAPRPEGSSANGSSGWSS